MNILGLIFCLIFLAGAIAIFALGLANVLKSVKSQGKIISYKTLTRRLLFFSIGFAVSLMTSLLFIYLTNNIQAKWYEYVATSVGGLIFGISFFLAVHFFIFHYYGKDINATLDKWLFRGLILFSISSLVFLFVTFDGFADYLNLTRPLPNGFSFTEFIVYPPVSEGPDTHIAWYAICILIGAIIVYFYCDHRMYQQYGKHGILESTFMVAFPAGIIGARLFYVLGELDQFIDEPLFIDNLFSMINIRDGGLTILGGAPCGIVAGVLWFMWRNKGYNIFVVADIIVPAILIAQAVGRWGNFFNCEVHGLEMSGEYWSWLPKIIYNNIQFGNDGNTNLSGDGNVFVPLFLIEGMMNMAGFFLISQLFGKKLRQHTAFGNLALGYFIWYGLVRAILEPLRDSQYIMKDFWSWFWSLAYIMVGVLGIILNHTIRNAINKKNGLIKPKKSWYKTGLINTIVFASTGVAFIAISAVLIATSTREFDIGISNYQFFLGLITSTVGISLLGLLAISIPYMIRGKHEISVENA